MARRTPPTAEKVCMASDSTATAADPGLQAHHELDDEVDACQPGRDRQRSPGRGQVSGMTSVGRMIHLRVSGLPLRGCDGPVGLPW